MRIMKTFSGQEFILEDDEADNIVKIKQSSSKAFLGLRLGSYVDTSAIESITGIPIIAVSSGGYPLSKDGKSFMREGRRIYVENFDGIKYVPDPKYTNAKPTTFQITKPESRELNQ